MAFIKCDFHSDVLGMATSMNVLLPQNTTTQIGMASKAGNNNFPILYLLHGLSDDHTIWCRRTSIERYVAGKNLAVVMPNVHRSFYSDMVNGREYWTFISEELPRIVHSFFPISDKRGETFVAGLSMGGYGAFKLALRQPERFAAAASLSGALDIGSTVLFLNHPERQVEFQHIFGDLDKISGSDNDLFHLAEMLSKNNGLKPKLYQCCGTEDALYECNKSYRNHLESLNYDLSYQETPGSHNWEYWDTNIQKVLDWLPV